jgi:hypothetical protein
MKGKSSKNYLSRELAAGGNQPGNFVNSAPEIFGDESDPVLG